MIKDEECRKIKDTMMRRKVPAGVLRILLCVLAALWFAGCEQPSGENIQDDGNDWEDWEPEPEEKPVMTGIEIASVPDITLYPCNYQEKGGLDFTGLAVNSVWSDGHVEPENEYTIDKGEITGTGAVYPVYIRKEPYKAVNFLVEISETDVVLQSVAVTKNPPAAQYLGKPFSMKGMTINGTYSDNSIKQVQNVNVCKVTGYDMRKRGAQQVTLKLNGNTVLKDFPVTVTIPAVAEVKTITFPSKFIPGESGGYKPVYIKGTAFDLADSGIAVPVVVDGATISLTHANGGILGSDILTDKGSESPLTTLDTAGMRTLSLKLDGKAADFDVYVADAKPQVYFDYGYMRHSGDIVGKGPGPGSFYVGKDKTIVLAPVLYLLGFNANHTDAPVSYSWSVTGGEYDTTASVSGETFAFMPKAAGPYTVTVSVTGRNFVSGATETKTASTQVVTQAAGGAAPAWPLKDFAPGQFTERGTGYGWSLGAALGYEAWDAGSNRSSVSIVGNGFETWQEPGIVWAQADENGNGLPDEMWYEAYGSDDADNTYKSSIRRRYAITYFKAGDAGLPNEYGQIIRTICWVDSRGRAGIIPGGWPSGSDIDPPSLGYPPSKVPGDWVTYTGTLLRDGGGGKINPGIYPHLWSEGYVDIYNSKDKQTCIVNLGSLRRADGSPAGIPSIRFVKVQTAYFHYGDAFGERSTEIVSATGLAIQTSFPNPIDVQ